MKTKRITSTARFNAMYARAIAYRNMDNPEARPLFEQVRSEYPLESLPITQLALYTALEGNLSLASRLAEQAVIQGRVLWQPWTARAIVRLLLGQREAGQADLKSAWTRTPEMQYTGYSFWWLYFSLLGDIPNAKKWRDKAIAQAQSTFDRQLIDLVKSLIAKGRA